MKLISDQILHTNVIFRLWQNHHPKSCWAQYCPYQRQVLYVTSQNSFVTINLDHIYVGCANNHFTIYGVWVCLCIFSTFMVLCAVISVCLAFTEPYGEWLSDIFTCFVWKCWARISQMQSCIFWTTIISYLTLRSTVTIHYSVPKVALWYHNPKLAALLSTCQL